MHYILSARAKDLMLRCGEHLKAVETSVVSQEELVAVSNFDHASITGDLVY